MALQMSGGGASVVLGPRSAATWHPDLDWLAAELAGPQPPKLVVITNPCNPTGEGVGVGAGRARRAARRKGGRATMCCAVLA
jgi:histidinol-phosphate/aromatic aminotransferase/cobyric acid decarboxylase-like protein